MYIKATLLGFLAILFWSSSIGLMRTITESIGASCGAAIVYTISGLMIVFLRGRGIPKIWCFSKLYLYGCGAIFVIYEILLSQSIGYARNRAQTMDVTLINYAWPCLTIVFAIFFKLQRNNKIIWLGILISFLGIIYSLTDGKLTLILSILNRIEQNPTSYIFALLAAILWALFCCITRKYGQGQDGTAIFLTLTGLSLWIKYWFTDRYAIHIDIRVGLEICILALAIALGYSFWNYGIQKGNLMLLSIMSYFTPLLSIFGSSLLFSIKLSNAFWLGTMMVTIGALICYFSCLYYEVKYK